MRDDDDEELRDEDDLDEASDLFDEDDGSSVEDESAVEAAEAAGPRVPAGPQDDPEVVGTLESFGARVELNDDGWVWRVLLYEKGGCDEALDWVAKLPEVRELWTIYTKVTPEAIEKIKAQKPDLVVYK